MSRHVIIFIRNPQLGKVKTRLAATVGDERALDVYRKLLTITREAALGAQCDRYLFYAEHPDQKDDWDTVFFKKREQKGRELGERMLNAFVEVFGLGAKRAVIIGSDCPEMRAGIIDDAFSALETADVVIGPATDGGYYLLGMKKIVPELFHDKQWSTSTVLSSTLSDAERLGLRVHLLPPLSDLDDEADLIRSGL